MLSSVWHHAIYVPYYCGNTYSLKCLPTYCIMPGAAGRQANRVTTVVQLRVCELLYRQAASRRRYHSTQIGLVWPKAHMMVVSHRTLEDTLSCVIIAATGMPVPVSIELGDVIPQSGLENQCLVAYLQTDRGAKNLT